MTDRREFLIGAIAALTAGVPSRRAFADDDVEGIRRLMAGMFDRPESRLSVDPIVAVDGHAIAGWSQGDMGGRALLRKAHGSWQLILCSGDPLKSADALTKMGLPVETATLLAARLAEAEAKIPAERLALFAKFDGIVMMDSSGQHPPTPHAGGQHPPMHHDH